MINFQNLPLSITSKLQGLKDTLTSDTSVVSQFLRPSTLKEAYKVDPRQDPIVGKVINTFEKGQQFARNLPGIKQAQPIFNYLAPKNETPFDKAMNMALNYGPGPLIAGRVGEQISRDLARKFMIRGGTEELVSKLVGRAKVMGQLILDGLKRIKDPQDMMELNGILHNGIARGFTPESEKQALDVLRAYPSDFPTKETMDFTVSKLPTTKTKSKVVYKRTPDRSRYAGSESIPKDSPTNYKTAEETITLYHGSNQTLDPKKLNYGTFLTSSKEEALDYARIIAEWNKIKVKQIDNLTKDKMIKVIDYIRLKKPFDRAMENSIAYLTEKFGVNDRRLGVIANQFENLISSTKTKHISDRVPLSRYFKK